MLAYLARRLLYAALTFLGITIVVFTIIHSVPGDPIDFFTARGGRFTVPPETVAEIRREFHLDRPLPEQYVYWLRGILTLDFGRSIIDHRPVMEKIAEKAPATLQLNTLALLVAIVLGVPIGLWSASRSGHLAERASAVTFFVLYSLPSFWVALLLMRHFSVNHDWLPLFGMTSDDYASMTPAQQLADRVKHLILPVIALSYTDVALFARMSKSALSEVARQDFIITARAKGVGEGGVLWRHAFRNALIPIITLLGLAVPLLLSGSVIVENIFEWDGLGRFYLVAIMTRDYPAVLAMTVLAAVATLLVSIIADVLYAVVDPRVRLEEPVR
jgi:peptide/nickel transport system permease protein